MPYSTSSLALYLFSGTPSTSLWISAGNCLTRYFSTDPDATVRYVRDQLLCTGINVFSTDGSEHTLASSLEKTNNAYFCYRLFSPSSFTVTVSQAVASRTCYHYHLISLLQSAPFSRAFRHDLYGRVFHTFYSLLISVKSPPRHPA